MAKVFDKSAFIDQLKLVAHAYGVKQLASELNKPYATLSNELREEGWAKPGFRDALAIVELALRPDAPGMAREAASQLLDMLAHAFGRIMYILPASSKACRPAASMRLTAKVAKEFSEMMGRMADAMDDGVIVQDELVGCLNEITDLIRSALELRGYLEICGAAK